MPLVVQSAMLRFEIRDSSRIIIQVFRFVNMPIGRPATNIPGSLSHVRRQRVSREFRIGQDHLFKLR